MSDCTGKLREQIFSGDFEILPFSTFVNCGVAKKVSKKEWMGSPEATAAMDKEWNKLAQHRRLDPKDKGIGAWDIGSVRNLADVKREARNNGTTIHHGRIAELCTQKNSELPDGHDANMYKGRDVLLGKPQYG